MIGIVESEFGLYLLEVDSEDVKGSSKGINLGHHSKRVKKDVICLWHSMLGHPNNLYLKKLFPTLGINEIKNSFSFETCMLSRHSRNS